MRKQQGFTLIELVIVVIILGLLGAAAVPRFLSATDDARDASVEGVAGGFASAVGLVRAQWELEGRPAVANSINYDGQAIWVSANGYPTSTAAANAFGGFNSTECQEVLNGVLAGAPSSSLAGQAVNGSRYAVSLDGDGFGSGIDACVFTLIDGTSIDPAGNIAGAFNNNIASLEGQGFTYRADNGAVAVFRN